MTPMMAVRARPDFDWDVKEPVRATSSLAVTALGVARLWDRNAWK